MPTPRRQVGYVLSHEQFTPNQLIEHAIQAEQVGFDVMWQSDHFHPWMDNQGHATHAWVVMGAIGQRTSRIPFGTGVTCPTFRYRPPEVAQAFATLALMNPDRVFLGIGSGESLNEVPTGGGWGPWRERTDRMAEAVRLIRELWKGDWVTHDGPYYPIENAKLYDVPPKPLPIYIAASGPKTARLVGELADGWVTVGSAALDNTVRESFREGARSAGKDPDDMPIMVEHYMVVGGKTEAEEAANYWRFIASPWNLLEEPDPREIQRKAEEAATLEKVYNMWTVSEDPQVHADALEQYFQAGITHVFLHSGQNDQARMIDFVGTQVLPLVRQRNG